MTTWVTGYVPTYHQLVTIDGTEGYCSLAAVLEPGRQVSVKHGDPKDPYTDWAWHQYIIKTVEPGNALTSMPLPWDGTL